MNDASEMAVVDAVHKLVHVLCCLSLRKSGMLSQPVEELTALTEVCDDEVELIFEIDLVYFDDVGVLLNYCPFTNFLKITY